MGEITCNKPDCATNSEISSIHCPDCIQKMTDKRNTCSDYNTISGLGLVHTITGPLKNDSRACPCNYGEPCNERCTCANPASSTGCNNCCTYGSLEQREAKAALLIDKLDTKTVREEAVNCQVGEIHGTSRNVMIKTEEPYITYKTALLAKEKGFDWQVTGCYYIGGEEDGEYDFTLYSHKNAADDLVSAPTQAFLQKWLREEHMIRVYPQHGSAGNFNYVIYLWDKPNVLGKWTRVGNIATVATYELAMEAGLMAGLKLIPCEKTT